MTTTSLPEGLPAGRPPTLDAVRQLLIEDLNVDRSPGEIDPDAVLFGTGLGLDSVDAMELLVAVEARFGVRLEEGSANPHFFRTVNAVVDAVMAAQGERA